MVNFIDAADQSCPKSAATNNASCIWCGMMKAGRWYAVSARSLARESISALISRTHIAVEMTYMMLRVLRAAGRAELGFAIPVCSTVVRGASSSVGLSSGTIFILNNHSLS
jgi:preprotein translocase subunit SecF